LAVEVVTKQISEQLQEKVLPRIEALSRGFIPADEPVTGAVAAGFLAGGGVAGTLGMPLKLVRAATGHPKSRSRMEVPGMFNNSNKELGRALAAIANADSQMRGRSGLLGLLLPTPRKVLVLGGAYMALTSVDPELLGPVGTALEKAKEKVPVEDILMMVTPVLDAVKEQLATRIDAIR
jgi:hypothetical protein